MRKLLPLFCGGLGFSIIEDDFINHEEDHHGDSAVEHSCADVIEPGTHEVTCYRCPDAVDGIYNAGNEAKRQQIPAALIENVAV